VNYPSPGWVNSGSPLTTAFPIIAELFGWKHADDPLYK
jgi:hypothetical protein